MSMSRKDWYERFYRPLPSNIRLVHVDHRNDHIAKVLSQVMDLHAFGQFLYHDVIAKREGGKPFTGYPNWFRTAVDNGWVPKPNKPFPISTVNQALTIFNVHTMVRFEAWSDVAGTVTFGSYLDRLRRIAKREAIPISRVPITDPFTRESMGVTRHPANPRA